MNPVARFLVDAGKELIAWVVEKVANGDPHVKPPQPHKRHRVVARPIAERPRPLTPATLGRELDRRDDELTPTDNPRSTRPRGH